MFKASLVFIACCVATTTVDGQVTSPAEARGQLIAGGLKLLQEGKFDEALSACGPWADEMEKEVLRRLKEATTKSDRSAMAKWFRVYFDYYPFGYLHWNSSHAQWNQTSLEFAQFLRAEPEELRAKHKDDIAAAGLYGKLVAAYERGSNEQGRSLAETIINNHPRSMFAAASVLSIADHCERSTFAPVTARMVYEKYLARLKQAGSPVRYQIWVMYAYAGEDGTLNENPLASEVYSQLRAATKLAHEKRFALLRSANAMLRHASSDMPTRLAKARKLYRQFLREYPTAFEAKRARSKLVQTYLREMKPEEAMAELLRQKNASEDKIDVVPDLFLIARSFRAHKKAQRAIDLGNLVLKHAPKHPQTPNVLIIAGEAYGDLRDHDGMVKTLLKAAELAVESKVDGFGYGATEAHWSLANYYLKEANWKAAEFHLRKWNPQTGCGNCTAQLKAERNLKLARSQFEQGKVAESQKTLVEFYDTDWPQLLGRNIVEGRASLLVDIFQRSSGLDSLEKFLTKESKFNSSVREVTVEYVELVRLAEKRDLDGLWQQLLDTVPDKTFERLNSRSDVPWKAERILKHLTAAKGSRSFLLKKVASAAEGDGLAFVALGLMRDSEVLRLVKERLSALDPTKHPQAHGHFDSFYAAVLLGSQEANKLVDEYADVAVNQWSPARRAIDWARTYR